jgi:hypothetical protein
MNETKTTTRRPPRRWLTHDEVERLAGGKGRHCDVRIRVWRGKDATPVVLASQVPGGVPPHWMPNRIANYAFVSLLGFPGDGMLYFADAVAAGATDGRRELTQSYFEFYGIMTRLKLFHPEVKPKEWDFLEAVLGQPIER